MKIYIVYFLLGVSLASCTEDYTYHPSVKMYYKFHRDYKKWADAKLTCENEGAKLAMPRNRKEMLLLTDIIKGTNVNFVFLGFHDIFQEGEYVTVDGDPIQNYYHTWSPGEPNNQYKGNEDCGSMGISDLGLNDYNCEISRPFLCQKNAPDKTGPQTDFMCVTNSIEAILSIPGPCSCLPGFVGEPPNCYLECITNADCPNHLTCRNKKCRDSCSGICGRDAECRVVNHHPVCTCPIDHTGDPLVQCFYLKQEQVRKERSLSCTSSCGENAVCQEQNGTKSCICLPEYTGNPYEGCRSGCVVAGDCWDFQACINEKCRNPCTAACGAGALCKVINHNPICSCPPKHTGDPFIRCQPISEMMSMPVNPCQPSPCGFNSQCRVIEGSPMCSCLPGYFGLPPNCFMECTINSDCPNYLSCLDKKCINPCFDVCGVGANCEVFNHSPICSCPPRYTGNPFIKCQPIPESLSVPVNPCQPSPCGPNSQCGIESDKPLCSCLPGFIGSPPNCYMKCALNADCSNVMWCINKKCTDSCLDVCGVDADCRVINHMPICSCPIHYMGDPFVRCVRLPPKSVRKERSLSCTSTSCGANAVCREQNGIKSCICLPGYIGDPYEGCRSGCIIDEACSDFQACINQKCINPCVEICGAGNLCKVINHKTICSCPPRYIDDPLDGCQRRLHPCQASASPCGPNSYCRVLKNNNIVCSCLSGFTGFPPNCGPECVRHVQCPAHQSCINNKCKDPCPGTCGENAECRVVNHNPVCTCLVGYTGDPFRRCSLLHSVRKERSLPCTSTSCGANAVCREQNGVESCICLPEYIGDPYEGCRLECVANSECSNALMCINQKCRDPCPGPCGVGARCKAFNHHPICFCPHKYTGDPFIRCQPIPEMLSSPIDPCQPSPCGPNSQCRILNYMPVCSCMPDFVGSPPNCRPECVRNDECPTNQSCINYKCKDPCPGTCGENAECRVVNYSPICTCPIGYTGNPFLRCSLLQSVRKERSILCISSSCGANAVCRNRNGARSCTCLPKYTGNPYEGCRPKCEVNWECPMNEACIRNKCQDPCLGACGPNSDCKAINHLPSCSCKLGYIGDPCTKVYQECYQYSEKMNKCYKLHLNAKKWSEARSLCQAEGGHLATIASKEEEDFLVNIINKPANKPRNKQLKDYAFLGAHDLFTEGSFINELNQNLGSTPYMKWKTGQPDGGTKENCLAMDNSGSLNDVPCDEPAIFFCQQQALDLGLNIRMNTGE